MSTDICYWSAIETAKWLREREVSVLEVTDAHLARLDALNPALNAVVQSMNGAREQAKAMDAQGPQLGQPLWGVPITIKINIDQAGTANSNGLSAFADNISTEDSPVVRNLSRAGALTIGRTNTPEFSMRWFSSNALHGVTQNPWGHNKTPGGSSGGAAAAVASGIGCLAHGNDLGGSLRYPAFCCGVASIRPSMGRVPAFTPSAPKERPSITQSMSVQGPIARSVADVRFGLQIMAQRDARDPLWRNTPNSGRSHNKPWTIGVATNPYGGNVDPAIEDAMAKAVDAARAAGAKVVEITPPMAIEIAKIWGDLLATEVHHTMGSAIRDFASPTQATAIEAIFERSQLLDTAGLLESMARRLTAQRAWGLMFDEIDALVMPTSLQRPFENDWDLGTHDHHAAILEAQQPLVSINMLGLPSVAIPTHLADGVPVGVQVIGALDDDYLVLDVAEAMEAHLGTLWQQLPANR